MDASIRGSANASCRQVQIISPRHEKKRKVAMAFEVPAVEPLKVAFSISAWKVILAVFVLINIKALPFVWHVCIRLEHGKSDH
jgi:hypothetical protein